MHLFRLAMCVVALGLTMASLSGCACRKKAADGNIGVAEGEGPLKDVHYAFDSYALDATAKSVLQGNADWLKANSGSTQIEGHCDERGTNEYNMVLGMNRANASMKYLRSLGIEAERMSTVSYGEELPLDPGHNEEAWAKNRRAHFKLNQ